MWVKSLVTIAGQELPVGRFLLLEGAAGSGKTTWLESLLEEFLPDFRRPERGPSPFREVRLHSPIPPQQLLSGLLASQNADGELTVSGWDVTARRGYSWSGRQETLNSARRPVLNARGIRDSELGGLLRLRVGWLDLRRPEELLLPVPAVGPWEPPEAILQLLAYIEPAEWETLAAHIYQVTGLRLFWDESQVTHWSLRIGELPVEPDRRDRARRIAQLPGVQQLSRGQQMAIAVTLCAFLLPDRLLLWDNAADGLNDNLAEALGHLLATLSNQRDTQWVVASAHRAMIRGLLRAGAEVTVLRLESATDCQVRQVPSEPLRRFYFSARAVAQHAQSAALAEAVVLVENEVDRAIYGALLRQWGKEAADWSVLHCFGLAHAPRMYQLLTECRVPVAVVLTPNVLQDAGLFATWCELLADGQTRHHWLLLRQRIAEAVEGGLDPQVLAANRREVEQYLAQLKSGDTKAVRPLTDEAAQVRQRWRALRTSGFQAIPPVARAWCDELADEWKRFGIFFSPVGVVSNWFTGPGTASVDWFDEAMRKIQEDACPSALQAFFQEIILWLDSRTRIASLHPHPAESR